MGPIVDSLFPLPVISCMPQFMEQMQQMQAAMQVQNSHEDAWDLA
jgi:hypothetical protein